MYNNLHRLWAKIFQVIKMGVAEWSKALLERERESERERDKKNNVGGW